MQVGFSHFLPSIAGSCLNKVKEAYASSPPLYDLAVRTFRAWLLVGLTCELSIIKINEFIGSPYVSTALTLGACLSIADTIVDKEIFGTLREWDIRKVTRDQSKKEVVLFCIPERDWNGVPTTLSANDLDTLKELAHTHSIVYAKAGSIRELNKVIDKIRAQGRKIPLLWLRMHGDSTSMALGRELITAQTAHKIHLSKLTKDANIILDSCNAGNSLMSKPTIAELIQQHAGRTRYVHAPSYFTVYDGIQLVQIGRGKECKVRFSTFIPGIDITANITYS